MTTPDPLSPSSLAAVPEVRRALAALGKRPERELSDEGLALLLAVRDATLSALARQTEEAVVEAAAQRMWEKARIDFPEVAPMDWGALSVAQRSCYRLLVRAALPLLVAPERARREQAEATLAAFIANVDEMHIGVGIPEMFTVIHEGKTYAVRPEVPKAWYKAIRDKWNKDSASLIATWNQMAFNEFQAKERAHAAEAEVSRLRKAVSEINELARIGYAEVKVRPASDGARDLQRVVNIARAALGGEK